MTKELLKKLLTIIEEEDCCSSVGKGLQSVIKTLLNDDDGKLEANFETHEILSKGDWIHKSTLKKSLKELQGEVTSDRIELFAYRSLLTAYPGLSPEARIKKMRVTPQREKELASLAGIQLKKTIVEKYSAQKIAEVCKKYFTNPSALTKEEKEILDLRKQKVAQDAGVKAKVKKS